MGFLAMIITGSLMTCICKRYHVQVQVQKDGKTRNFIAEVLAVRLEWDLALLTVNSDTFWRGLESLTLGDLPELMTQVDVVGYPFDETFCATTGNVSRVQVLATLSWQFLVSCEQVFLWG